MFQSLFRGNSLFGKIRQHFDHQIQKRSAEVGTEILEHFLQVGPLECSERVEERWIEGNPLFVLLSLICVHGAKHPENGEKLVSFCLPLEERGEGDQLSHNAARSPDINGSGVLGEAEHELGSPVVPGDDVGGVLAVGVDDLAAAEITNFDDSFFGKQDVFGFEVPVSYIFGVDVFESIDQLIHVVLKYSHPYLDGVLGDKLVVFDGPANQTFEVVVDEFKDDVLDELAILVFGVEEILGGRGGT